jgi:hypothetical protein
VSGARHFQGPGLLQHCRDKGDEYHTATAFYLTTLFKKGMGLTQAAVHHEENDQSRNLVDASEQISDRFYQYVDSKESDSLNQVNESIVGKACDTVGDSAICDDVEKNDASTSIRQESQGDSGVSDYNISSDEHFFAENQAKNVQDEQELPGQHIYHNEIINSVGEATDGNDDPSKDPDHTIDAEKSIIDEPDRTLDSMEINIVGEANEANGHPSQESDVIVNAENSNVYEPGIIYDRSKTIDTIAEQTESMVDDDFDHNDVSKRELSVQCIRVSEEVNTVDKVTGVNGDHRYDSDLNTVSKANDVHGHSSQEIGVQIDRKNSNVDGPNIHDSSKPNDDDAEQTESIVDNDVEQNDVSQNMIQGLQNKTVSKDVGIEKAVETTNVSGETTIIDLGKDLSIQGDVEMNNATPLEGSSVILGKQDIVHDGDDQASNSEEVEWNDDGDGGYGDNSEVENDSSDSSIKLTWKHIKKSNKKFRIAGIEDDDDRSESCKSDNSRFSQTSSIEPQGQPELLQFS